MSTTGTYPLRSLWEPTSSGGKVVSTSPRRNITQKTLIVSISLDENIDPKTFTTKVVPHIEKEIENPNVMLIFPPKPVLLWKYLKNKKFVNGRIYVPNSMNMDPSKFPFKIEVIPDALHILNHRYDVMLKYDKTVDRTVRYLRIDEERLED